MNDWERVDGEVKAAQARVRELRERIAALRRERPPEPVEDYVFATADGTARLSELFGRKRDLMVVHNMGSKCPMCTLWADGFSGILAHLEDRCAFVVSTPDPPAHQAEFARSRGWRFRMVSTAGSSFAKDMGYANEKGVLWPGVSVFRREGGRVVRLGHAVFGPLDDFGPMFNLLALFPDGEEWWPKLAYPG
jgi:predicted dithiol-disulfide oxidoreductase (DUF899 family)